MDVARIWCEEQDWEDYFANLALWWDNQGSQKNPKALDFKHRMTKRSLWIDGWYTLVWTKIRFSSGNKN